MASIILTYRCNLNCSYCFANGFVNREKKDITIHNFLEAVSYITKTESFVSLIGGEPAVHPGFQTIMELLIANPKVENVNLFTNGILIDPYIQLLTHPKVDVVVNCNSPYDIGESNFAHLKQNLDMLFQHRRRDNQLHLGFNLYNDEMDYSYMIDLLQRYKLNTVRTSLTVPDFSTCSEENVLVFFKRRKKRLLELFHDLYNIGVMAFLDCNHPPYCIWSDEEKQWLKSYINKCHIQNSKLINRCSPCSPSVTIYPDLQADRCYGMADYMKVKISDFDSVPDIIRFFENEIDSIAYKLPACDECKNCREWKARHCIAGCIGYKSSRIRAANEMMMQL